MNLSLVVQDILLALGRLLLITIVSTVEI